MEFLYYYGLFLAKAITIVAAVVAVIIAVASAAAKPKASHGEIDIEDLSEYLEDLKQQFETQVLNKEQQKELKKTRKQALKVEQKSNQTIKPRLFVIDFKGGVDANEVTSLREEITAVLMIAQKTDEVLIKVDSGGGVVHGYGLAASQIIRLKSANIPLTISVDKVAASGGYMMACVADKIIAAPFAILGSIGVMAQIPNFSKLLKKHDVDYELFTAGEFKRTITMFGENDEKGRAKFKEELEETHLLFKDFVHEYRQSLDIDTVATGEHWFGTDALKKGLCDLLQTSDDYILSKLDSHKIFAVKCTVKKALSEKLGFSMAIAVDRLWSKWLARSQTPIQ